ncbi:hypothetical protein CPLU01_02927 [Colletotrichum plurivorum]|uniref:Uncharacterized protein n=1 Tax=Colletotrichum plurivorum TaxID=2175906 RepID=A0A8H6NLA0_9PEZI|nr:hypothetical protein CPLU01_02927 [Colletotrichum plurivorum]
MKTKEKQRLKQRKRREAGPAAWKHWGRRHHFTRRGTFIRYQFELTRIQIVKSLDLYLGRVMTLANESFHTGPLRVTCFRSSFYWEGKGGSICLGQSQETVRNEYIDQQDEAFTHQFSSSPKLLQLSTHVRRPGNPGKRRSWIPRP